MTKFNILSVLLFNVLIFGCADCTTEENPITPPQKQVVPVELLSPVFDTQYSGGANIVVEIKINDATRVKNLSLFIADTLYAGNIKVESQKINISTTKSNVGFVDLYLAYTDEDEIEHRDNRRLIIFSDITPKQHFASAINSYTHNTNSYTQGLEFYNGKLYESTGQKGASLIAEVNLYSGNQIRTVDLEPQYFGEGLTILNDTIYQITWQSRICKLYDMDFNAIGEFHYENEGWGLTNNGKSIIMTNGTSEVVWRNPRTFEIEKTIYAFADQQDYQLLNEIELINDKLFANVYTTNNIVEIDTTSGKVLSVISCDNIVLEGRVGGADVLNGIAYNPLTKKTYLTGKLWPKLFEVTFE